MKLNKTLLIVIFLISSLILTTNYLKNFTRTGKPYNSQKWQPDVFQTYTADIEQHIVTTLELVKKKDSIFASGGFRCGNGMGEDNIYLSNSGLNAKLAIFTMMITGGDIQRAFKAEQVLVSFLLAATLTLFAFIIARDFNFIAGIIIVCGALCSEWMVFAARNLNWLYFLMILPFVFSFLLFPLVLKKNKFKLWHFLLIIGGLGYMNALRGYEFITNAILATACGPIYYGIADRQPLKKIMKWTILVCLAGTAGFFCAMTTQLIQGAIHFGSFKEGFKPLIEKIIARTYGPHSTFNPNDAKAGHDSAPPNVSVWLILHQYLPQKMLSIPFLSDAGRYVYRAYLSLGAFVAATITLSIGIFASALSGAKGSSPLADKQRKLLGLSAASIWAIGAGISWTIIAKGHSYHHLHMNSMSFYIPYVIMFYALVGAGISMIFIQIKTKPSINLPDPETNIPPSNNSKQKKKRKKN